MAYRNPVGFSLRDRYGLHLQIGFVLSLALLLAVAQIPLSVGEGTGAETQERETVDLRHVQQTRQEKAPPAPPKPPVPRAVPDDKVIEPSDRDFEPSLGLGAASTQSGGVAVRPDCGGPQTLRKKTYYPPSALDRGLEGRVLVEFVVGEDGDVESPRVVNGAHEILDQAALRAVRRLECAPGKRGSQPVRAEVTKPVVFTLPQRMDVGRRH